MGINRNIFIALCISIPIVLAGCPMPSDSDAGWFPVNGLPDSPTVDEESPGLTDDPSPPPPVVPDRITDDPGVVADFLNNDTVSGKSYNVKITDSMTLSDRVTITGDVFFSADKPVTITAKALAIPAASSLRADSNVTLVLSTPDTGQNPDIRYSINDTENNAGNPQGTIVINNGAALSAVTDDLIWNSAARVEINSGGTINANNMTITPAGHAVFNSADFPLPFTFTAPDSGYTAYKVANYIAGGLALMRKAEGPRTGNAAEWVPSNFDNNEKYVYITDPGFLDKYADTLAKIAGKPFILAIGQYDNKEWYEDGATYGILAGSLGSAGSVTVNVTDFPVVLPRDGLSGGTGAMITVASGAYLDAASTQTGAFGGSVVVQSGGAVRVSAWPSGEGPAFKIEYGGRIADGEGKRDGTTTRTDGTASVFDGWLIGRNADNPRAVWQYHNEYDLGGSAAFTGDDFILTGALKIQQTTGITCNVNISQGSVLTLAAGLDLGTGRGMYAAKGTAGGSLGSSNYNANYSRPPGKLVLAGSDAKVSRAGTVIPGLAAPGEYAYNGADTRPAHSVIVGGTQKEFYSLE